MPHHLQDHMHSEVMDVIKCSCTTGFALIDIVVYGTTK